MDLTLYQWLTLAGIAGGFVVTWIVGSFNLGRAVEQMKAGFKEQIDAETDKISGRLAEMASRFNEEQRSQDQQFGEVGLGLRQKITDVEKEMHAIEIWGRDNFVLKSEFVKATDSIRSDIKEMAADIKSDLRDITAKIGKP